VAGTPIGFRIAQNWIRKDTKVWIQHPGPGHVFLAKAPNGVDVAQWDGAGDWFKVAAAGPVSDTTWTLMSGTDVS
jgi:hypothetical protein